MKYNFQHVDLFLGCPQKTLLFHATLDYYSGEQTNKI